jgi:hypothetical protein
MEEPAYLMRFTNNGKKSLSIMPEGGVADIVPEGYGLDQILIEPEKTPYGPCDLRHKLHMQDPVGNVIIFYQIKNLSFVYIAGISQRMENPIRVNRKTLPVPPFDVIISLSSHPFAAETGPR